MPIAAMDIPIFVINLDRAPARLAHAAAELKRQGLNFQRVSAVDGLTLAPEEIERAHDKVRSLAGYHVPMQRGEIACFLSHRLAWETYREESRAPFVVILEDDFELRGELGPLLAAITAKTLQSWDVIKLWGREKRAARRVAELTPSHSLVRELVISKRTVGQIVSREGAAKLLAKTLPIFRPIDVQLQYPWELGIEVLTIRPSILVDVGESLFGSSTTKGTVDRFDGAKLRREVRRVMLQADLAARSLAYFAR
jgi:glycosyl transferase, family 25